MVWGTISVAVEYGTVNDVWYVPCIKTALNPFFSIFITVPTQNRVVWLCTGWYGIIHIFVLGSKVMFSLVGIGMGWFGACTDLNGVFVSVPTWYGSVHPKPGQHNQHWNQYKDLVLGRFVN